MDQTIQNENFEHHVKRIEKSIDKLPEKCKQIFKLSKKEGLTNIEIADYLQISLKTVEAQISIAFSKIRKDMLNK
jgi:RNA polymerase sigma-70 factor (ECF subfamily)